MYRLLINQPPLLNWKILFIPRYWKVYQSRVYVNYLSPEVMSFLQQLKGHSSWLTAVNEEGHKPRPKS